jgi:sigma-B regulation protein RsbU (phosphoserine phosphatase)
VAGEFGLGFYAGMPLTTHDGYNLGTLCVIDQQQRELSDTQVATLTDLAALVMDELELRLSARTAVGLEAELRRTAEDVAATLQQSLLPPTLPEVTGLEFAARYHVANREQVGGDFYDVIQTETGCAVVVGDACGKGTKAAALTGTARWTLRTVVLHDWTPADALARLNSVLVRSSDDAERYVTLAVVAIAPTADGAELTVAVGGHPRPLIVRAQGGVEAIGSTAPIVGWSADAEFNETHARLSSGDVLVLFTDGTLEAVAGSGETDDSTLRRMLHPLGGQSAEQVADALDAALGDDIRDDAAFLVVRAL